MPDPNAVNEELAPNPLEGAISPEELASAMVRPDEMGSDEDEALSATPDESSEDSSDEAEERKARTEDTEDEADDESKDEADDEEDLSEDDDSDQYHLDLDEYGGLTLDVETEEGKARMTLAEVVESLQSGRVNAQDEEAVKKATLEYQERESRLIEQLQARDAFILRAMGGNLQPPDPKLAEEDPVEYMEQLAKFNAGKQRHEQLQNDMSQRAQEYKNRKGKEEAEKLILADPSFKDQEVLSELVEGLQAHYGISSKEVMETLDHRAFLMARDALKWRTRQSTRKEKADKILKKPVRTLKAKPATTKKEKQTQNSLELKRKLDRPHTMKEHLKAFGY